jgi:hypothetical protein
MLFNKKFGITVAFCMAAGLATAIAPNALAAGVPSAAVSKPSAVHSVTATRPHNVRPQAGGLPPKCGPAYDGVVWVLSNGVKLICTRYQGVWQWIVYNPQCAGCCAGAQYAREVQPSVTCG